MSRSTTTGEVVDEAVEAIFGAVAVTSSDGAVLRVVAATGAREGKETLLGGLAIYLTGDGEIDKAQKLVSILEENPLLLGQYSQEHAKRIQRVLP